MKHYIISTVIAGLMVACPAVAQSDGDMQPATPATEPAAQTAPAPDPVTPDATIAAPMDADPDIVIVGPDGYTLTETGAVTADQLKGVDIYDPTDNKIAEIADVVIGSDEAVTGIVTDVGGFLGMGEHRISLAPDQVSIYKDANDNLRAYVTMTKDELKALPKYEEPN